MHLVLSTVQKQKARNTTKHIRITEIIRSNDKWAAKEVPIVADFSKPQDRPDCFYDLWGPKAK